MDKHFDLTVEETSLTFYLLNFGSPTNSLPLIISLVLSWCMICRLTKPNEAPCKKSDFSGKMMSSLETEFTSDSVESLSNFLTLGQKLEDLCIRWKALIGLKT